MSQVTKSPAPKEEKFIEYVPFGGDTKIKLSLQIVLRFLCKPTARGALPTEADAMKFMMLCQARALNPFEGDAWLVGYDGQNGPEFSMITGVQAFYKRAEVSPEYDGIESGIIVRREDGSIADIEGEFHDDSEQVVGGWAKVFRKNRSHPTKARIRINAFAKGNKFWKDNPAGMIAKVAEADALRREFPTKLGGLYLPGEMRSEEDIRIAAAKPAVASNPANFLQAPSAPDPILNRSNEAEQAEREMAPNAEAQPEPEQREVQAERPAPRAKAAAPQDRLLGMIIEAGHSEADFMDLAHDQGWALAEAAKVTDIPPVPTENLIKKWPAILKGLNAAFPNAKGGAQ